MGVDIAENAGPCRQIAILKKLLAAHTEKVCREAWEKLVVEGAPMLAARNVLTAPKSTCCPHMQFPWRFSVAERRFAILSQSNNINCASNNARWGREGPTSCPRCHASKETCLHVLNGCEDAFRKSLHTTRHDSGHRVLTAAVDAQLKPTNHRSNQVPDPAISTSGLRPDEIVTRTVEKIVKGVKTSRPRTVIADVKNFFPAGPPPASPAAMSEKMTSIHTANQRKYASIAADYGRRESSSPVPVATILLPTVGPTPLFAHQQLVLLGFKKGAATKVLREMMVQTIKKNLLLAQTLSDAHTSAAAATPENDGFQESNQAFSLLDENSNPQLLDENSNPQLLDENSNPQLLDETSNGSAPVSDSQRSQQATNILQSLTVPPNL